MPEMRECFTGSIESVEPTTLCTNPENALLVLEDRSNDVATQTVKFRIDLPVAHKLVTLTVIAVEPGSCPNPESALSIFVQGVHDVVAQALRIPWDDQVPLKLSGIPIKSVEALAIGSYPDHSILVF
jgi:hypothetical protein